MTVALYKRNAEPIKGSAYTFSVALTSQSDTDIFKTSPTLAAGDITVSKDGGNFANIATLPTQIQSTGVLPVALSADEMNADRVVVLFHDVSGSEWQDLVVEIATTAAVAVGTSDLAAGAEMDLVDAPNSTAITAIQAGLSTLTAAQVWSYTTRTLSSFGTLIADIWAGVTQGFFAKFFTQDSGKTDADAVEGSVIKETVDKVISDAVGATPETFWTYTGAGGRTLTMTAAEVEAAISGEDLTAYRDCTYVVSITGLGSLADREKLFFTVKSSLSDDDEEAILQIEETDGLIYLNKVVIESPIVDTDGSITVDEEDDGDVTIRIEARAMAELSLRSELVYDVAVVEEDGDKLLKTIGTFRVLGTATRTWDAT